MWIEENSNPVAARVGDCAVRAVAKALDISWEEAYSRLSVMGFGMGDLLNSNNVWSAVLRQEGFYKGIVDCPDCVTVAEFAYDNPKGIYVLRTDGHVVTVIDGDYFDIWDSGNEPVQFYWYKKD